ncbi:tRNA (adenosine(37)-N6)-threonylcarbamoyltransferase complex ATPase subunit type 1 TsaE [Myxosarcina sp. GI1]|uniref:tRNA (adenosine(37)-N6)-threonylcarbamoyltransferase complex ATPase subunit type 1 TsaE n=1 Tax=Myxosarcina sp. GI1 TaxID=1541065 RepID=UPI00055CADF7|nr:tRNA (adenosine(37)-N6)-threonylcarbamoyltransferase complex ATPase subunit type 1 TsaE [Myxosarcina sp. GI1]
MPTIILKDITETQKFGCLLGKTLPPDSTILLSGELGAGKTTLIQGIAKGLNIKEAVVSPTFTLINEYLDGRLPLYHLDLYRLSPNQTTALHPEMYWEGIEVAPGITAIEWRQRLSYEPPNYLDLKLSFVANSTSTRKITWQTIGKKLDFDFENNFARDDRA